MRQRIRQFKEELLNVYDEHRSGRFSVRTDDFSDRVSAKMRQNRCFAINNIFLQFQIVCSSTLLRIMTKF